MSHISFRVSALPTAEAERLRTATTDDHGNRVEIRPDEGPCRHCLTYGLPGVPLALVAYSPFAENNAYKEVGPIFLHAAGCEAYGETGLPPAWRTKSLALRGYDREQRIARAEIVVDGSQERRIQDLLADPDVAFIHARSLTHGCYLFRIDRAS